MKEKFSDDYVFLPMDKYGGKLICICRKLYYTRIRSLYQDTSQFNVIHECGSHEDAMMMASYVVKCDVDAAGMMKHWDPGPSKGPPMSFVLPKNKMVEEDETLPPDKRIKFRVVFSQFRHPLKRYGQKIGRCLSLLVNEAARLLKCVEMTRISDVKTYAQQVSDTLQLRYPRGIDHLGGAWLWELDIQEFFPSLDRDGVLQALQSVHDLVSEARGKRKVANELRFAICRDDKKLDHIGVGYAKNFDTFTFSEVLAFATYEVQRNDLFVVGDRVFRQVRGVAIGGTLSAQLSYLYAIHREHQFFDREWDVVQGDLAQYIVPTAVPAFPFRFRDNLVGAAIGTVPIEALRSLYTQLYDLQLQQEGWGEELTTLESHLHIDRSTGRVQMALKNKLTQNAEDQRRALVRYPDWYAPNAKMVLRSLVPALVQKCVYYSTSCDIIQQNIEGTLRELTRKGYPGMWWKPAFNRTLCQQKVPSSVVRATHESKYWRLTGRMKDSQRQHQMQ